MTTVTSKVVDDFGETTVSSNGQITLPSTMRQALHLAAGDRVHLYTDVDGNIVMAPQRRRSIVDIARANAFKIGDHGRDLDALIDEAVTEAMNDQELRVRSKSSA